MSKMRTETCNYSSKVTLSKWQKLDLVPDTWLVSTYLTYSLIFNSLWIWPEMGHSEGIISLEREFGNKWNDQRKGPVSPWTSRKEVKEEETCMRQSLCTWWFKEEEKGQWKGRYLVCFKDTLNFYKGSRKLHWFKNHFFKLFQATSILQSLCRKRYRFEVVF